MAMTTTSPVYQKSDDHDHPFLDHHPLLSQTAIPSDLTEEVMIMTTRRPLVMTTIPSLFQESAESF